MEMKCVLVVAAALLLSYQTSAFPIEASPIRLEALLSSEPNLDAQLQRLDMLAGGIMRLRREVPDTRCKDGKCLVPRTIRQLIPFV
ncbi:unnamed protein product [Bursaphelenchus xylophilus]|uniref:(pine wood nematode) hypothetical protein n=1 Tax=Bursaphelenchus xylophilus TaxID=6326 RepID=A0A1I7S0E6_BURXY|nr:unnamed protein product [Bursaphelenchus xylophilus]CAG9132230.1 unnamed protein product [Bursaphelenchus xylophilus]